MPDCLIYVDDLASLSIMRHLVFPHVSSNDEDSHGNEINLVALDCEWRPEGYYKEKDDDDIDLNKKLLTAVEKLTNPAYSSRGSKKAEKAARAEKKRSSPVSVLQLATRTHVFVIDLLRICRSSGIGNLYITV